MLTTTEKSTKPFWKRERFAYLLLIILGAALVLIAASITPASSQATELPRYSAVTLPADYQTRFVHYATVQRLDGTIRNLYINPESMSSLMTSGGFAPPVNTVIVIEGFYALKNANGDNMTDSMGRYVSGAPFDMIHVLEKRSNWSTSDFIDDNRIGEWNFGSFDAAGGHYDENMSACFHCHNATSRTDFLYSAALLRQYARTEQTQFFLCDLPDRLAC